MYKLVANDKDLDQNRIDGYISHITKFSEDADVTNIAVMGPYGSGKSTILEQLKKKEPNKYVNINMIEFSDEVNDLNKIEDDLFRNQKKEEMVQKVEQSIVQQLIYQENPNALPFSKLKREYPTTTNVLKNIILFLVLCCGSMFFGIFNLMQYIIDFKISFRSFALLLCFLVMVGIGCYLIYEIILYFYKNFRLVKINYSRKNTSIECERYESVYNKNLDELLYFFKESSYDTVIFEDIDRYNDLLFFSHLRELNSLLNKSKTLNKKITFIYAIRDDLFAEKDKTKFFDYIVPIVPIMDYSNSAEKFKQHLSDQNLDNDTINLLSGFVSDYRTLKNICNEYKVYKDIKNSEIYSDNNLLAILTLKNLYPKEFSQLQFNKSILNYIFNEAKAKTQVKIKELQDELDKYTKALKDDYNFADPKYLVLGLIKDIIEKNKININNYATITGVEQRVYPLSEIFNMSVKWEDLDKISRINVKTPNDPYGYIELNEYQKLQFAHCKYLQDNKDYLINKTAEELIENINLLESKINHLTSTKASKFYNDYPKLLNDVVEEYYTKVNIDNKDERFIRFIKNLILNDLIGENYNRYISLTHGQAKDENDNLFIHNVYAKIDNDFILELNDLDYIFEQLKNDIFENRYSFNINILRFLAKKNNKGLSTLLSLNSDRLNLVYENLSINNDSLLIINETLKNSKDIEGLLVSSDKTKRDYWFKALLIIKHKDFKNLSIPNNFKEEIKNYDLIKLTQIESNEINNFIENCKGLKIKFSNIVGVNKNTKLYDAIIKENLYEINYKNIQTIDVNCDFEKITSKPIIKEYLLDNLNSFVKLIVDNQVDTIQSEEFNQTVIKGCGDKDLVKQYIIQNKICVQNIDSTNDIDIIKALCVNKENTMVVLKRKNVQKEARVSLICELQKFNDCFAKDYAVDLCDIIKSEKIYHKDLLTSQIYLDLFKSQNVLSSDKDIILDNIIEICDKQNLLRIIKVYDEQFKRLKKEIVIPHNSINIKLSNKLIELRVFEKVRENDNEIVLKKIEGGDLPPII